MTNKTVKHPPVHIIGGGLAGVEAAFSLASSGIAVTLFEMRPERLTGAHRSGSLGELVCSNSLRSDKPEHAVGLLKREMSLLHSLVMECARRHAVAAGGALAVDRELFSSALTTCLEEHPLITVKRKRVDALNPEVLNIIATGPLTEERFLKNLQHHIGKESLYFYDAIAPIVDADSIDEEHSFVADRYGKTGEGDYLNLPMNRQEYEAFVQALISAEKVPVHDCEKERFFEGCLPIEVVAERGVETLRFGTLKPVGLPDKNGEIPYAVMQLRKENKEGTAYNLVGCQTRMKPSEQKRVFSLIPGLKHADFFRFGYMHRNSFICSPRVLNGDFSFKKEMLFPSALFGGEKPRLPVYLCGQLSGVEGYVESAASGLITALQCKRFLKGLPPFVFPDTTAMGALSRHITGVGIPEEKWEKRYQPSNINYAHFPPALNEKGKRIRKKREKQAVYSGRALETMQRLIAQNAFER